MLGRFIKPLSRVLATRRFVTPMSGVVRAPMSRQFSTGRQTSDTTWNIFSYAVGVAVGFVGGWSFYHKRKIFGETVKREVVESRDIIRRNSEEEEPTPIEICDEDVASDESLWNYYERWGERYNLPADPKRFEVFKEFVKHIHYVNNNLSYRLDANMFTDLSEEEIAAGGIQRRHELMNKRKKSGRKAYKASSTA